MRDLIEALTIFSKYHDLSRPTHCEHDVLMVFGITEDEVSEADRKRLNELSFSWTDGSDGEDPHWYSFRFGSA